MVSGCTLTDQWAVVSGLLQQAIDRVVLYYGSSLIKHVHRSMGDAAVVSTVSLFSYFNTSIIIISTNT